MRMYSGIISIKCSSIFMMYVASSPLVKYSVAKSVWSLHKTQEKFGFPFLGIDSSLVPYQCYSVHQISWLYVLISL